jgi:hypothetical protein
MPVNFWAADPDRALVTDRRHTRHPQRLDDAANSGAY